MLTMDTHGQAVTEEELAVVAAAALAASSEETSSAAERADLGSEAVAAVFAALAAAGATFTASEPSLPAANMAWRRPSYEQSIRPRWR